MKHAKSKCSHTSYVSHKRDFQCEQNSKILLAISDLKLSIGDDVIDELAEIDFRQARMLERGTGNLRKCKECGDAYVNDSKSEINFGTWLNKNGFVCFFCRNGTRNELKIKKGNEKFERKREIMKRVWELYISRLNEGVKITKLTKIIYADPPWS